ncbi:hypothetical protein MUP00_03610 [Candidatus Bathyarchaeota archaeon]|nr:hypothetical protein [Candidatus Bathyarchaeota archaeon]
MAKSNDGDDTLSEEKNLSYCISLSGSSTQSIRSSYHEDFLPLIEQSSIAWVDIKVEEIHKEAIDIATKFGFSKETVKQLLTRSADGRRFQGGYQDFDTEMGLLFPVIRIEGFNVTINPLIILLKESLILTIRDRETHIFHNLHRYAETFLGKLPQNLQPTDWLTLMLIRIIDENNDRNFEQLQEIDEGSEDLTRDFKSDNVLRTDFGEQIVQMKHALITYLSGLWKTSDTLNSLCDGDATLVSDEADVLNKMSILEREVRDQIGVAENLSDVLASGLEFLQSIYNNQLQDKNNLLQDKNNQLADLNNTLQEKNNLLSEKNNNLQEYNNRLTLHNNRLSLINNKITLLGGMLAIIGAGFVVPNTIATVLSQTAIFQFTPADMGWYIALILVSTIVTTMFVWSWVKSKNLLPRKQEENQENLIADEKKEVE